MTTFKVGDVVQRRPGYTGGSWPYLNSAVIVTSIDGEDIGVNGGRAEWYSELFTLVSSGLTKWERDTALAMAITLAKLIAPVATSRVVLYHEARLADWLRDCVCRDLEGQ